MSRVKRTDNEANREFLPVVISQYTGLPSALQESLHNQTLFEEYENLQIMQT